MKPLISDVNSGSVNTNAHPASTAGWPHEPEAAGSSFLPGRNISLLT